MRRAKIGDKIRIVSPLFNDEPYDVGDILTVKDVRGDGAVYVEENDSTILPSEFTVVDTKPTDVKVGDKIRIVRAFGSCGYYTNGDEFTVRSLSPLCPGGVFVENIPIVINETEYEVIERAEEKQSDGEPDIKVGDKVKVVDADCSAGYYDNGDILTVDRIDEDGDIYVKEHPMIIYRWEVEPYKGEVTTADAEQEATKNPQKSLADEVADKVMEILEARKAEEEGQTMRLERVAELLCEIEYMVAEIRSLLDIDEEEVS